MKTIKYQQKNVFLISGMFAGSWIWENCYKEINANITMMDEPLCYIGESIEGLTDKISYEINKQPGKITLIGNSLGSLLCLTIAAKLNDKIENVIISGSAGFGNFPFDLKLRQYNTEAMRPQLSKILVHNPELAQGKNMDRVLQSFAQNFKSIVKLIKASNTNLADSLIPQVKAKIIAIWGDHDSITPYNDISPTLTKHNIDSYIIKRRKRSDKYSAFALYVIRRCISNNTDLSALLLFSNIAFLSIAQFVGYLTFLH